MERFPQKLRTLRVQQGMTQQETASELGIGQPFLHKMETGQKMPNVHMLVKIARLFQVSLDDLALDERDV